MAASWAAASVAFVEMAPMLPSSSINWMHGEV